MTIFPPEAVGLQSYGNASVRPRKMMTDGGQRNIADNTRRYDGGVLYHYERDFV